MYEGALRKRLEMEQQEQQSPTKTSVEDLDGDDYDYYYDEETNKPRSMSMKEALAKSQGNSQGVLDAMNDESSRSSLGPLFERTVVQRD